MAKRHARTKLIPKTMRAAAIDRSGDPDVLKARAEQGHVPGEIVLRIRMR